MKDDGSDPTHVNSEIQPANPIISEESTDGGRTLAHNEAVTPATRANRIGPGFFWLFPKSLYKPGTTGD